MSLQLIGPKWTLQPFELELARLEAERLSGVTFSRQGNSLVADASLSTWTINQLAHRLAFSRAIRTDGSEVRTHQHALELAAGGGPRKVTSHALHGLHPYKGKFYPQLARSLINICDIEHGGILVDPFAGCGTSVLEASLLGIRAIGVDANPMGVLVSRSKLQLLSTPVIELAREFKKLKAIDGPAVTLPDEAYLRRWFPPRNIDFLRRVVPQIQGLSLPAARAGATVALSSVLREASYQDPTQLRVYRRSHRGIPHLPTLFHSAVDALIVELDAIQSVPELRWRTLEAVRSRILEGDARKLSTVLRPHLRKRVDAVVTSPPYANALPYIDTDRLSLRAFGLLPDGSQRLAEEKQIGNREITLRQRRDMESQLLECTNRLGWIPTPLSRVLKETALVGAEVSSGFRKQRTTALLFAYFRDMRQVLTEIDAVMRPGGSLVLVVGDNHVSGSGGTMIRVPTGDILVEVAEHIGFEFVKDFDKRLTSYGAADTVHQRNAMTSERVLMLRRRGKSIGRLA